MHLNAKLQWCDHVWITKSGIAVHLDCIIYQLDYTKLTD